MIALIAKLYSHLFWFKGRAFRNGVRVYFLSKMLSYRLRRQAKSTGENLLLRGKNSVTRHTVIGEGCVLNGIKVYGGAEVTIGNHVIIANGTIIQTQNHDYDTGCALPYGKGWTLKPVRIDDCVWIGMNVMILPGTHIGEGAVIQAGSVVHGEVPPLAIAGGNPAKVFAWRDKGHYDELKDKACYQMW